MTALGHSWAAMATACCSSGRGSSVSTTTVPSSWSWSKTSGAVRVHCPAPRQRWTSTTILTEGLVGGYRLVLFDHVEITPTIGAALRHDLPTGPLGASTRHTPLFGVAIGWVFR